VLTSAARPAPRAGRISRNRLGNGYVVNTTGSPSDKSDLQVFHPIRTGIQFTPP
jgi:hypothetical protein